MAKIFLRMYCNNTCMVCCISSDDFYGHYLSSGGYMYAPVAPVLSVADMIPPPPPPPGEGPLEGTLLILRACCHPDLCKYSTPHIITVKRSSL